VEKLEALQQHISQQRRRVWDVPKEAVPTNLVEAEKQLKTALATVKEVLLHARDIRAAHLKERAEAAATEGRIMEKKKKMFEWLRRLLGKTNNGGLAHIIDSNEELVLDPAKMFALLLERN
jgi:SRSO17 transposase